MKVNALNSRSLRMVLISKGQQNTIEEEIQDTSLVNLDSSIHASCSTDGSIDGDIGERECFLDFEGNTVG